MMNYRKELNGLRAIALVPVILFHLGVKSTSGGFFGVDIFLY
jgi:peptidoglycan/LPS O-acetylase OafA/YrhL